MTVRSESSAETAARFLATRPNPGRRGSSRRRRKSIRRVVSLAGALLPLDIVRAAVWIPNTPVSRAIAARPIAPIVWPSIPRESNAEMLRRLRADAVARGLCYQCRHRPAKPGTRYCAECIKRAADYAKSIAYKKCQSCGVDVSARNRLQCSACERKDIERNLRVSMERVQRGMCGRCGRRPVRAGSAQCVSCLDDQRDMALARRRAAGSKPMSCPVCRELGINGTGHTSRTHDRWMERRKSWINEGD